MTRPHLAAASAETSYTIADKTFALLPTGGAVLTWCHSLAVVRDARALDTTVSRYACTGKTLAVLCAVTLVHAWLAFART